MKHKQKLLITGGNGFIAKSIYEDFNQNPNEYELTICNSKELNLLDSIKVDEFIQGNSFDVILHCATYDAAPFTSDKDPTLVLENNLRMFLNLHRNRDHFKKLIFFGSGAEFGRENWKSQMNEDYFDQFMPDTPYGLSKYIMTQYAGYDDKVYNLRLFGLFGKHDDYRYRLIPNLCCRAILSMDLNINNNHIYDFLYIDDLVKIVRWVINENPAHNVYNVCSGKVHEFKNICQEINRISGKKLKINVNDSGSQTIYSGENSRLLRDMPGFTPMDLPQAIEKLYAWYSKNRNLFEKYFKTLEND